MKEVSAAALHLQTGCEYAGQARVVRINVGFYN
jgi:hypothetical protein